jgi:hypothetical protein
LDLNRDDVVNNLDIDEWLDLAATENGYTPPFLGGDTDSFGNAVPAVRVLSLFGFNVLGGFFAATGSRDPTRGRMEILTGTGKLTSATRIL